MMSAVESVLREFGEAAGIADLAFSEGGHVDLELESGRRISIERSDAEVLVSLSLSVRYDAGDWLLRAWKQAHYSRPQEWPVQAALRESADEVRLVALLRMPQDQFAATRLRQAIEYLSRWLDAVEQGY